MDIIQAVFLALVQGITEFLPISSSAHLVLAPLLFGWSGSMAFDVVVHAGTLCAVVFHYRRPLLLALRRADESALPGVSGRNLLSCMAAGSLPILAAGFLLYDLVNLHLRVPLLIALATVVFAIFLWLADRVKECGAALSPVIALWIGLGQVLALIPGVSRSGITITVARLFGLSRRAAADFSFVLAIPVILAATAYEVFALYRTPATVALDVLVTGFVVAAGFALATIRLFVRFVERIGLLPFVIYRLLIGGILLSIYL